MRTFDCERVRDVLPDWTAGRAEADRDGVRAHLAGCEACAAEEALIRKLRRHRAEAPEGLARRILESAVPHRRVRYGAAGVLTAAAVVALAWFGGRALLPHDAVEPVASMALEETLAGDLLRPFSGWPETDGLLAGALMVDALMDEEIELLLAEMET